MQYPVRTLICNTGRQRTCITMQNLNKAQDSTKFGTLVAACAMFLAVGASAQSTPEKDKGTMDSPPPTHERTMDTPSQENRDWDRFDETTGAELGLEQSQMDRLIEVDSRYEEEITALGEDATDEREVIITRRNEEVRAILTPEQYARWEAKQNETPKK